jgi:hypothetical protein
MREHMRWLLKWLHPDKNQNEWESVFTERVLKAWRDAGTVTRPHQSAAHERLVRHKSVRRSRHPPPLQRWVALPLQSSLVTTLFTRRRIVAVVIAGMLGLAIALAPAFSPS